MSRRTSRPDKSAGFKRTQMNERDKTNGRLLGDLLQTQRRISELKALGTKIVLDEKRGEKE